MTKLPWCKDAKSLSSPAMLSVAQGEHEQSVQMRRVEEAIAGVRRAQPGVLILRYAESNEGELAILTDVPSNIAILGKCPGLDDACNEDDVDGMVKAAHALDKLDQRLPAVHDRVDQQHGPFTLPRGPLSRRQEYGHGGR